MRQKSPLFLFIRVCCLLIVAAGLAGKEARRDPLQQQPVRSEKEKKPKVREEAPAEGEEAVEEEAPAEEESPAEEAPAAEENDEEDK